MRMVTTKYILKKILFFFIAIAILMSALLSYVIATRHKGVSPSGSVVNAFYKVVKPKNFLQSMLDNPNRIDVALAPSNWFAAKYEISYKNLNGDELITASATDHNDIHLIYLHGGAYILGKEGMENREQVIGRLIENTKAKVTFFDYPVAPESQYEETLEAMERAYHYLLNTYPNDRFMMIGDSAGGGLALSFSQMIKDRSIKQPEKLILYSPWLDLSMTNPEIEPLESYDMLLPKEALIDAATKYAGADDLKNPLVSPIYGDFNDQGEILMLYGTHELFYADALKLEEMAIEHNYNITFKFYTEMQHVWILFPIREANQAFQETYDFILNDG
ncbi:MAG: alpha/beta hydrolase [Chloroflexota bacterium]